MKSGLISLAAALLLAAVSGAAPLVTESGAAVETITSLDQVEQIAGKPQLQFWQVVPPSTVDPFYLHPECVVRSVDWSSGGWPKKFIRKMYAR